MRYIVRRKLSAHEQQFSGSEGTNSAMIYAETAAKAREIGAKELGLSVSEVEVVEYGGLPPVFGADQPLTKEEAEAIYNQETSVVPGTWQPL